MPQPNPLLLSVMEAKWDSVGPKERDALRYTLYALNVLPYEGQGPTVPDFFVPYDALEDITPYVVTPRIFAIGGHDGSRALFSCEVLDLSTGTWSPLPSMATRRYAHGVVRVDDKIFAIGGLDGDIYFSSCEVLDLPTGTWSSLPSMATRRGYFGISSMI